MAVHTQKMRIAVGEDVVDRYFARPDTLDSSKLGNPTDDAFAESLSGRFRAECLTAHWFLTLADAAEKLEAWRRDQI